MFVRGFFAGAEQVQVESLGAGVGVGEDEAGDRGPGFDLPRQGVGVEIVLHVSPALLGELLAEKPGDLVRGKIFPVDARQDHACARRPAVCDLDPNRLDTAIVNRGSKNPLGFFLAGH